MKNQYGWNNPSEIIYDSHLKPNAVQMFAYIADTCTANSVELMWKEPSSNSAVVDHYKLEWWTSEKSETKKMSHEVTNLQPNTEYNFRVSPITRFGSSGESSNELVIKTISESEEKPLI